MKEPLVSVMITTYNHALFIEEAIEGVFRQETDFAFEVVIGEDCSTDGTRDIVLELQRKHPDLIRVITSEKNVGSAQNCYRSMKACRGKYVAFCEGDDYWHDPHKLQKQVEFLEGHPGYGMVHSDYDLYENRTKRRKASYLRSSRFRVPTDPDISQIITECRGTFRIQTCTVAVRRDLYQDVVDGDPYLHQSGHFLMGDVQLWAELSLVSRVGFLPDSLATYRLLDESASRSLEQWRLFRFEQSYFEMCGYLCNKHRLPPNVKAKMDLAWSRISLRKAFHERSPEMAQKARNVIGVLSFKEWLLYAGARSTLLYVILHHAALWRDRLLSSAREPAA
jgi:glycosyltransferase involved in cell wall biosynthesis